MMESTRRVSVNQENLNEALERAKAALEKEDYELLKGVADTLAYLTRVAEDKDTTIRQLRSLLFGAKTERTRDVLILLQQIEKAAAGDEKGNSAEVPAPPASAAEPKKKKRAKGHGRNGADAYVGAERICVPHGSIKHGDRCPECRRGKVYGQKDAPESLIRVVGQPPLQAKVYELERMRCNLCGHVFTADRPEGVGPEKYDATAGAMIGLLKYGSGLPFYRQEQLQQNLGIPLPASTQWEIVREVARVIAPAQEELIRQAAQGDVVYNDDTGMKVLALNERRPIPSDDDEERTGVFTSGIVSTRDGRKIGLFFTGRKHAGENLSEVLTKRASELDAPIQMCDALSRNVPKEFEVVLGNCLAHGRRQFIDVAENFPTECRHVLERLGEIYSNDALARARGMSPTERLSFHQAQSGPVMEGLQKWFTQQLEDRLVEPNSGLGRAIKYFRRHWTALTLFLRQPGAPLDNNLCERALKLVILHRKNALFFKTENGARVGDVFMSLIQTCKLGGVNPFDYLTELQRHAAELKSHPQDWMPWNYRTTMERARPPNEPSG